MLSPHYPQIRLSTRQAPTTNSLIDKGVVRMAKHHVPRPERDAYTAALFSLRYLDACDEARKWITLITPLDLPEWDLTNSIVRDATNRASLVLNVASWFPDVGRVPMLHVRSCFAAKRSKPTLRAYNASARTAFLAERARREAGGWPSMAFCAFCIVEQIG